jgi:8-oxo-dGTP diphosphatase
METHKFPRVGTGVLILNDKNQVLLGLRHEDKDKADSELHGEGTWTMPGGKLDWQETPRSGAIREMKEETGLSGKNLELISVTNDAVVDHHFITIGFKCTEFEGEAQVLEPDEITEWKWYDLDSLPDKIFFPSKKLLDNYLAKRLYSDE